MKTQKKDFFIDSLKKGQKCFGCKKIIKNDWCWNGHFWHSKCKDLDTSIKIKKYLKGMKKEKFKATTKLNKNKIKPLKAWAEANTKIGKITDISKYRSTFWALQYMPKKVKKDLKIIPVLITPLSKVGKNKIKNK